MRKPVTWKSGATPLHMIAARVINPMLVDGQIHGGVAHGIGNALYEEVIHDESGQILQRQLHGLLLARRDGSARAWTVVHIETPDTAQPARLQRRRRGRDDPAPTAVALAIEDALSDLKVKGGSDSRQSRKASRRNRAGKTTLYDRTDESLILRT